jgi:hypothetical protein
MKVIFKYSEEEQLEGPKGDSSMQWTGMVRGCRKAGIGEGG